MDQLRPKQQRFVKEYIENGGNATQAVIDAGYDVKNENVAANIGSENLIKPKIQSLLQEFAPTAVSNIKVLANGAENEGVRLNANKDLLDRAGFSSINKSENISVVIESNPSIEAKAKAFNEWFTKQP